MSRKDYAPKVGQVWESRDWRDHGKRIRLFSVDGGGCGFVHAETVYHERRNLIGHRTRIAWWRLPDYYRLVEEPHE